MPAQQLHDYSEEEFLYNRFMEPALRQAMSFLSFPKTNARVLDAGCGPGGLFALLLEALGLSGALVAIDRSTPHLEVAKKLITSQALEQRVQLAQADLESTLPYPDGSFDGVWSADVITPDDFADIPSVVSELFRVLKPAGSLFLFYGNWLRQQLLPGHSRLEHLISIAKEFAYARDCAWKGHNHPECAERWLREASCQSTTLRLLPVSYHQPLRPHVHRFLADRSLGTFYDKAIQEFGARVGLDASDLALWRRLSDPQSPDFILNQPDYVCVQVAMLVVGQKPPRAKRAGAKPGV
jgi:SAM-dependent methyltransferase